MTRSLVAAGPSVYDLDEAPQVGEELYERELLCRLPAQGIALIVGLPPGSPGPCVPGVRRVALPRPWHWLVAPLLYVPWAIALLRGRRVDLLRAASVRWIAPSLLAARALSRSAVPVVVHHHHFESRWRSVEAAILRRADLVFTVSEHSRRDLEDAGIDPARIRVVHNGVAGPETIDPEPPGTWPADGLRLLSLGRLEARKRPALSIETLAALTRDGVAASLVLAGAGPQTDELVTLARELGVADRVRLLGRVDDVRKWRLYDGAQLLLFGSTTEGFGLVVAEAQSRGLPVIAAAGTASTEAMAPDESGVLAPPNPRAFARAVQEIGARDTRARMSEAARAHAAGFTWDASAAEIAATLRQLVGDRG